MIGTKPIRIALPLKKIHRDLRPGSYKALRGGAWFSDQYHVRAADRTHINPENRYDYVGFRPVLVAGL